eukprot:3940528-Rhodomonas_salina.3
MLCCYNSERYYAATTAQYEAIKWLVLNYKLSCYDFAVLSYAMLLPGTRGAGPLPPPLDPLPLLPRLRPLPCLVSRYARLRSQRVLPSYAKLLRAARGTEFLRTLVLLGPVPRVRNTRVQRRRFRSRYYRPTRISVMIGVRRRVLEVVVCQYSVGRVAQY